MKNKVLKAVAFIIGVTINYWLIHTYFPVIWSSLHPLLTIFILVMVIIILGLSSAVVTAIENGYSGKLPKRKTAGRKSIIGIIDWIILYPLKLFVFTFLLYLVSSYYIGVYSNIYHNPEILKNIGGKSWPVILAPAFPLMIVIAGGFIWILKKINRNKTA